MPLFLGSAGLDHFDEFLRIFVEIFYTRFAAEINIRSRGGDLNRFAVLAERLPGDHALFQRIIFGNTLSRSLSKTA